MLEYLLAKGAPDLKVHTTHKHTRRTHKTHTHTHILTHLRTHPHLQARDSQGQDAFQLALSAPMRNTNQLSKRRDETNRRAVALRVVVTALANSPTSPFQEATPLFQNAELARILVSYLGEAPPSDFPPPVYGKFSF